MSLLWSTLKLRGAMLCNEDGYAYSGATTLQRGMESITARWSHLGASIHYWVSLAHSETIGDYILSADVPVHCDVAFFQWCTSIWYIPIVGMAIHVLHKSCCEKAMARSPFPRPWSNWIRIGVYGMVGIVAIVKAALWSSGMIPA